MFATLIQLLISNPDPYRDTLSNKSSVCAIAPLTWIRNDPLRFTTLDDDKLGREENDLGSTPIYLRFLGLYRSIGAGNWGIFEMLVAHTGFEPVISALRGRCPRPLDECALRQMVGDTGLEPVTSTMSTWRSSQLS